MRSLGSFLEEARKAKGYSLEEAQNSTKIQLKYLRALEEENFKVLPEEAVFVKGFLRSYAQFLDIDANEAIEKYDLLVKPVKEEVLEQPQPKPNPAISAKRAKRRKKIEEDSKLAERPAIKVNWFFIAGAFFAIILGSWGYNQLNKPDDVPVMPAVIEQQPPKKEEPPTSVSDPTEEKQEELAAPVVVKTNVESDCWVQVSVDGKVIMSEVLPAGTEKEWQGQEEIALKVGNAGGIKVSYNGGEPEVLGQQGEVLSKTFTKEDEKEVE